MNYKQQLIDDVVKLAANAKERKILRRMIGYLSVFVFVIFIVFTVDYTSRIRLMDPDISVLMSTLIAGVACIVTKLLLVYIYFDSQIKTFREEVQKIASSNPLALGLFNIATGRKM
jgi:hypothetical protein